MHFSLMTVRAAIIAGALAGGTLLAAQEADQTVEAETLDINHVGFTVSDLDATASFFIDTLGWQLC